MQEPSPFPELAQPPVQAAESAGATLTFVFSDIEGSTRLEQAIGTAAYGAIRERHRTLLREAFAAHGGEEQGTEGDSFFVVFRSARGAIAAALAAQRALAAEPWPDGAQVRVRMGVHSGEARTHGGSLVGLDINRAARIAGGRPRWPGARIRGGALARARRGARPGSRSATSGVTASRTSRSRSTCTSWWPTGCAASSRRCARVDARPNNAARPSSPRSSGATPKRSRFRGCWRTTVS